MVNNENGVKLSADGIVSPEEQPATIGKEVLVFLEAAEEGKLGTKKFTGRDCTVVKAAQKGVWWRPHLRAVNDLWGVYETLRELSRNPKMIMVRGELADRKAKKIYRRHKNRGEQKASLLPRARYFLMIDVDGISIPGLDFDNPEPAITAWLRTVRQLRGCDVIVNLSSSWGLKELAHLHLGLWCDRPVLDAEARAIAEGMPFAVDSSLYTPSQPHYFSDPVFTGGAEPVYYDERFFFVAAEEGDATGELHVQAKGAGEELQYWIRRIGELDDGSPRHTVINSAGYFLGKFVKAGVWTADDLAGRLLEACAESGVFDEERLTAAGDELRRAIADGESDTSDDSSDWRGALQQSEEGKLKSTDFNLLHYFRNHPALRESLRYNTRSLEPEWCERPPWDVREGVKYPRTLIDADAMECSAWLNLQGMSFALDRVHKAFDAAAQDRPHDSVVKYLVNLPTWDGIKRIERLCIDGMQADDCAWAKRVGELLIDSLVFRGLEPGCKCDTMPVFFNRNEGTFKSTFLAVLVGGVEESVFSDCVGDYSNVKHFAEQISSNWLMEDGDLSKLKTREMENVMRALSSQKDEFRPAFGRRVVKKWRGCVFVGTTNQEEFLNSTNQNRRLPPLAVGVADIEWLKENRDQIFAEGVYRYREGLAKAFIAREELPLQFREAQRFTESEAWDAPIEEWLNGSSDFENGEKRTSVQAWEVAQGALGISVKDTHKGVTNRIGAALRRLGWDIKTVREGGLVRKVFVPADTLGRLRKEETE